MKQHHNVWVLGNGVEEHTPEAVSAMKHGKDNARYLDSHFDTTPSQFCSNIYS